MQAGSCSCVQRTAQTRARLVRCMAAWAHPTFAVGDSLVAKRNFPTTLTQSRNLAGPSLPGRHRGRGCQPGLRVSDPGVCGARAPRCVRLIRYVRVHIFFCGISGSGLPQNRKSCCCRAIAAPEILGDTPTFGRPAELSRAEPSQQLSYSQQYKQLFQKPLDTKKIVPKPSKEAQKLEPDGRKVPLSDVYATQKTNLFRNRSWAATDKQYIGFMVFIHGLCLAAPFTFSWPMVGLFFVSYLITGCLGITLSYHRQLSHRSFSTPKWLEYTLAYCGVLAIQGEPMEWVSSHRYHHLHTDTPLDPHSPYEGFWWSHMGWLLDNKVLEMFCILVSMLLPMQTGPKSQGSPPEGVPHPRP